MGGQVALALVLLVASGLMVRSFQKLQRPIPASTLHRRSRSASDCRIVTTRAATSPSPPIKQCSTGYPHSPA